MLAQCSAAVDGVGDDVTAPGMGGAMGSSEITAETVFMRVAAWHIRAGSSRGPGVVGGYKVWMA